METPAVAGRSSYAEIGICSVENPCCKEARSVVRYVRERLTEPAGGVEGVANDNNLCNAPLSLLANPLNEFGEDVDYPMIIANRHLGGQMVAVMPVWFSWFDARQRRNFLHIVFQSWRQ